MPARPKTSDAEIVQATRQLIERDGREGFSIQDVAAAVGIRAPSLYGRFRDRADLICAVERQICAEAQSLIESVIVPGDAEASLRAQARAVRDFAQANPHCYALIHDDRQERSAEGLAARTAALAPMMRSLATVAGPEHALEAVRVLIPFLQGYIAMERMQGFQLGGDLDVMFENGVTVILRGLRSA